MTLSTQEIREIFVEFFEEKGHLRIPAASLIPAGDPTLLFINSGMAPLKKFFVGEASPPRPELCSIQPCVRTRLIEMIGNRYFLTFFELLGNWAVNSYFKETAIELAYELLVERFGFPKERLYATVYKGDPALNRPPDYESARAWERVGLGGRIIYLGNEGFWGPIGDTGPCGPVTDVFLDTGDGWGEASAAEDDSDPPARYLQIWNAGNFMELDKRPNGTYGKPRFKSVDTGSGLERIAMTVNRLSSVYEIDLLSPVMREVEQQLSGRDVSEADRRILTDHLRAVAFILAQGVVPANKGRGYVPRRLIRKCVAIVTRAGMPEFDFGGILDGIVERSSKEYPVSAEHRRHVAGVFACEQKNFAFVIGRGFDRLRRLCEKPAFTLSGAEAFVLSSAYGMPLELIRDFVRGRGGQFDEETFLREFRRHQRLSCAVRTARKALDKDAT